MRGTFGERRCLFAAFFAKVGVNTSVVVVAGGFAFPHAIEMVEYVLMDDVVIIDDVVMVLHDALVLDNALIRAAVNHLTVDVAAMVAMPSVSVVVHTMYSVLLN